MELKTVSYRFFRNIEEQTIEFAPGVNLLYGDNAQGKTNALEGVYLCAQGRSHRTAHERDYIKAGSDFAKVTLVYTDRIRTQQLELRYLKNGRKYCKKNGMPLKKMSEFIGNFRAVIFCPEHLSIVKEGPGERRGFMDAALCQTDALYLSELQKYNVALMQRNKLISDYPFRPEAFLQTQEFWAQQMAESAELLSAKRAEYIAEIDRRVKEIFSDMTHGGEEPELVYKKPMSKDDYMRLYMNENAKELRAGTTLFGVHKDDVEISLNGRSARAFASQGQQRSLSVAMKLAEGLVSKEKTGEFPVFLLDDVLSELDEHRKNYILGGLAGRQVIITCCDRAVPEGFPEGRVIHVENGQYTKIR